MNWQADGTCAQPGVDPELHFPTTDSAGRLVAPSAIAQAIDAIRMCNGCPVLEKCRERGMTQNFGIWGGLTEQDRRSMRRRTPIRKTRRSVDELVTEIQAETFADQQVSSVSVDLDAFAKGA